jgi:hypothetical protein
VDRGGEKVRRGWTRTGPADLVEAVRRKPALLPAVLAELLRQAADLAPADEAEVYRRVLEGAGGSVPGELRKFVAAGLAAARTEKEAVRQARALRQLAATLRGKLGER